LDALAYLHERPEIMQLLVADFAVVRVVADVFQVAYNEISHLLCFKSFEHVSEH
jgi:hypothetical protein